MSNLWLRSNPGHYVIKGCFFPYCKVSIWILRYNSKAPPDSGTRDTACTFAGGPGHVAPPSQGGYRGHGWTSHAVAPVGGTSAANFDKVMPDWCSGCILHVALEGYVTMFFRSLQANPNAIPVPMRCFFDNAKIGSPQLGEQCFLNTLQNICPSQSQSWTEALPAFLFSCVQNSASSETLLAP